MCYIQISHDPATGSTSDVADGKPPAEPSDQQAILASECGFTKHDNELLTLSSTDVEKKDVVLSSLNRCRVVIQGSPSTVHVTAVRDCIILCGPTSGSVFIDDCQQSVVVVACHQLRVHRTSDTNFYLHVTSRAIIEDCSSVQFAPYNWTYTHLDEDFRKAGLDRTRNNWNAVDDFNWLAADKQSPNWSVMDKDARISSWSESGTSISTSWLVNCGDQDCDYVVYCICTFIFGSCFQGLIGLSNIAYLYFALSFNLVLCLWSHYQAEVMLLIY